MVTPAEDLLLSIGDLNTRFFTMKGVVRAVDGVSLEVGRREAVGIVGESGCGKSVTALSVMRLVPDPPGRIVSGSMVYKGRDLLTLSAGQMMGIRGKEISMVFQDPMTYLNPIMRVGDQIAEVVRLHHRIRGEELRKAVVDALRLTRVPSPESVADWYPHQLSGGMRQRALIAMAIACRPSLLIADEPTTALDVTIQAQILQLLKRIMSELEMAVMLISHDLSIVAYMCDRVYVMYAGKVVEEGPTIDLYEHPAHPYTQGLLQSIPSVERYVESFPTIEGVVPDLAHPPSGCRFADRCARAMATCRRETPTHKEIGDRHSVSCWLYDGTGDRP